MPEQNVDALVVGAGFGGIHQLKTLTDLGLETKVIDVASDVGGTWYWNRYPGAMSDTEAHLYRYSWDSKDLNSEDWKSRYVYQPEVLAYLQGVVKRWGLRKHFVFNTEMTAARWDDEACRWRIETSGGATYHAKYLVTALGLLSRHNLPDVPGIQSFQGEIYHTGQWPEGVSLEGKRVGVIGNGSTGVQVITEIAKSVGHLVSFQRNPQYCVPSGQGPVSPEYREHVTKNYDEIWRKAKDESLFAFGFQETARPTFSVDEPERREIYEAAWRKGGGFNFMFGTFSDISTDESANDEAAGFIKDKIRKTVKDPEKARKLLPTQLYAKRPLCDSGYYEQFNRDNVDIVSLKETPIIGFSPTGITTSDGKSHDLDIVIFATGFDAVDGNYTRLRIQGRNGESLKDHWSSVGPTSYLGISVPKFPNLFMILGPNGPFCNLPPAIESQVEFITETISSVEDSNRANWQQELKGRSTPVIEATSEAETSWTHDCDTLSAGSLFRKTDSWIFGSNVPGKKHAVMFYFAGLSAYRKALRAVIADGWRGFRIS